MRKPHLKLHHGGGVSLLSLGRLNWTEKEARAAVKRHHGSLHSFGLFLGFPGSAVCLALNPKCAHYAGRTWFVRAVLGLPSLAPKEKIRASILRARTRAFGNPPRLFSAPHTQWLTTFTRRRPEAHA